MHTIRLRPPSGRATIALVFSIAVAACSSDPQPTAPYEDAGASDGAIVDAADGGADAVADTVTSPDVSDTGLDTPDTVADAAPDDGSDAGIPCGMVMRRIPGGTFTPARAPGLPVTVASFCMDRFEVKVGSYQACVTAGVCDPLPAALDARCNARVTGRNGHPLDCVDYARASAFCAFMGKRLPTSDELEWAMRGASPDGVYPWGTQEPSAADAPPRLCWAHTSPDHTCIGGAHPSGDTPQGISDLAGNVWEWSSTPGDAAGTRRVHGGAYWDALPLDLFKASYSEWQPEDALLPAYGFRCVQ